MNMRNLSAGDSSQGLADKSRPEGKSLVPRGRGRPPLFTPELAERVLELTRQGYTLLEIGTYPDCPSVDTIQRWEAQRPDFCGALSRAREAGAHALTARAIQIADTGVEGETSAQVARARLRVDARFRLAAAWNGPAYGNRASLAVHNPNPQPGLALSPEQIRRLASLAREVMLEGEPDIPVLRQLAPIRR
jgi:hypothetical protein